MADSRAVGSDSTGNNLAPTTVDQVDGPGGRPSDLDLIRRVQKGEKEPFDELMTRYVRSIYRVAYSFTRNHADADDLSQEAFIRAWRAIRQFNERYQFYTWLRRITVNLCLNHLKRRKRVQLMPLPMSDGDAEAVDIADPRAGAESSGLRRDLDRALAYLPADQRAVFVLRVDQELSYSEISELLRVPVGTVMSRLNRAREKLRESLREYMPER